MRGEAAADGRLDVAVAALVPELSRSQATRLVKDGRVRVDGVVVTRAAHTLFAGAVLQLDLPPPAPAEAVAQDLPLRTVYEDEDLVVVDKEAGMVVHPGAGHADGTLVNALLHHVGDLSGVGGVQRPGIVHRLDRGTSGLLVVAKHDRAHQALAAQFADKTAGRVYLAVCVGVPADAHGTIDTHLARHPKDRLRFASTDGDGGRQAITDWWRLGAARGLSLLRCELRTGRTHQIRVHLREQGWPLACDTLYARRDRPTPAWVRGLVGEDRPLLHAWRLRFRHPTRDEPLEFCAPVPDDLAAVLARLELDVPGCDA
ncbi:MAG: RluA family pseudouridine synthase [Alphaproteobacteria bacterium]|nr:RluA family pseudouridine synthase [Alphaproteobacteria bacterium]